MTHYLLDPTVCFLNHGSFGATPQVLLDHQYALRQEMETEPIDFLFRGLMDRLGEARDEVAGFLGSDPEGTVFVNNATAGVNAVIRSMDWQEGDQILTTSHRYDAVRRTLDLMTARYGVTVVEATIPFPLDAPEQITQAIADAITDRTRLLLVDHISSPTALIFPVETIVRLAHEHGLPILVDGAHAPGQVDLALEDLGADFWVGNLHKWLCAPKGAAALVVAPQWRERIHPPVISHGYGMGLQAEFGWTGTDDPTAWLTAPAAIALHREQGDAAFRKAHHALVKDGRQVIADALGVTLPHPDDDRLYGSMATIPLPCGPDRVPTLFDAVRQTHKVEVPIIVWDDRAWVRISGFAAYNRPEQYHQLAKALQSELL